MEPLRVFVYNRFWLRFANLAFDLTDLDVYEKESREILVALMNYLANRDSQNFPCFDLKGPKHEIFFAVFYTVQAFMGR